jgi:hypothetical protein
MKNSRTNAMASWFMSCSWQIGDEIMTAERGGHEAWIQAIQLIHELGPALLEEIKACRKFNQC